MPRLPAISARKVIGALARANFYIHHQKGSHVHLRHRQKSYLHVTVPYHTRFDLPPFVIQSILKQAEISVLDFLKLL